jgi:4a-hydroxytetrahydrobiopterin dehydratase
MEVPMKLTEQKSKPIIKGARPLLQAEVGELMREIPEWSLSERTIVREFRFTDFREAMEFVNRVAAIANDEDHHPDLFISYNKVRATLSTHKIQGLSMNDFIVAAKIDDSASRRRRGKAA